MSSGLLFELILAAVAAVILYTSWRKGFVRKLAGLLSFVLSALLAYWFAPPVALFVYNQFVRGSVVGALQTNFAGLTQLSEGVDKLIENYRNIPFLGDMLAQSAEGSAGNSVASLVGNIEGAIANSVVLPLLTALVFALLFFVISLLLRVVARGVTGALEKIPLAGGLNAFLGLILGAIECAVLLVIAAGFLHAAFALSPQVLGLTEEMIDQTLLFKLVYRLPALGWSALPPA